jgi:hypothetical protein
MPNSRETVVVSNTKDLRNAVAAGYTADQIVIQSAVDLDGVDHDQVRAEAFEAGRQNILRMKAANLGEEMRRHVAVQERVRIRTIQGLVRPGLENIAERAIVDGLSAEQFALSMLSEVKDRGITMEAIRADAPAPVAHAKPGDDAANPRAGLGASGGGIFARRRAQVTGVSQ